MSHGAAERTAPGTQVERQMAPGERGGISLLMLSNPVYSKPFRGARRQEVSGAALEEGGTGLSAEETWTEERFEASRDALTHIEIVVRGSNQELTSPARTVKSF